MTKPAELAFIVAPTGKCGTNYIINVLVQLGLARLPDVDPLRRQDYLLSNAHLLEQYVRDTVDKWRRWTEYSTAELDQPLLLRAVGEGLARFIGVGGLPPIAVKTPSPENLRMGPALFPHATFILIVRDGRDATESGMQSNYWGSYEEAFAAWADGVAKLRQFIETQQRAPGAVRWALVRYESLLSNPKDALLPVASALGSPNARIDVTGLNSLPVFGSSDYGRAEDGTFAWTVVVKTNRFEPLGRWHVWEESTRDLFKKLAGDELISLGYERDGSW